MRSEEGNREGRAGEHMNLKISIGSQDFAFLREHNCFLVDKTDFIKKWWESGDAVTLITRPRRFGKTLNMSMLNCFFSRQYEHRGDLFEGLNIWSDLKYRNTRNSVICKLQFSPFLFAFLPIYVQRQECVRADSGSDILLVTLTASTAIFWMHYVLQKQKNISLQK